jgi:hypothetical protein
MESEVASKVDPRVSRDWRALLSMEISGNGSLGSDAGACGRDYKAPDVFFFLRNEGYWGEDSLTFSPTVLLAVAADLPDAVRHAADLAVGALAGQVRAKLRAFKRRPWAYAFGPQMMTDAIQDIVHTGLFKVGPVQKQRPTLDILAEPWEVR